MDVVVERCSGLDVHRDTVMATVRRPGPAGQREEVTKEFGTTTAELLALRESYNQNLWMRDLTEGAAYLPS